MQFKSVTALLGWAFQIEATAIAKTAKLGESSAPAWGGMSPHDQHGQASMVMAKVNRLPFIERTAVWAYFTAMPAHVMALAESLPAEWPRSMRVELVTGWAMDGKLKRTQKEMCAEHGISEDTMTRRKKSSFCTLDGMLARATAVIELQHLDLIVSPSRKNAHRSCCQRAADCVQ